MATWYNGDPMLWIEEIKQTVRNDWDNGILFTGGVGTGKSTAEFQVMRAVDDEFDLSRCFFQITDALRHAAETPRYGAWALDEAHISGRKAMHGEIQALNDYLQDCRGLNHHWGLCFHQEKRVDKPILERVSWNLHKHSRSLGHLRVLRNNYESLPKHRWWRVVDSFKFAPNKGRMWAEYLAAKDDNMHRKRLEAAGGDGGDYGFRSGPLMEGISRMREAL